MRILSRAIFREITISAVLGTLLFVFVLFLRTIEKLSSLLVRVTAPPDIVAKLFLYALPSTVHFALPLGVLVGILIGLSRMSADSEITAMRASGISSKTVLKPVMLFAFLAMTATALATLWLTPLSLHLESKIAKGLAPAQLTGGIESRLFDEQFPNKVLYIGDVVSDAKPIRWRDVFIADVTPQDQLQHEGHHRGEGPRVIVAQEATVYPDPEGNRIILNMKDEGTTERDKDGHVITTFGRSVLQTLQAQKPADLQANKTVQELDTGPLYKRVYRMRSLSHDEHIEAAIELHQRFALPLACILLALVGVPLGISSRKGGKSSAFVMTVIVAFVYYLSFIGLIGLAKKGNLPVPIAVWTPDAVFALAGIALIVRLEEPGDRDLVAWIRAAVQRSWSKIKLARPSMGRGIRLTGLRRFGFRPMLMDAYVLNGFIFYFAILVTSLVLLVEVFTFFELLGDMIKNNIPLSTMLDYLWHLAPQLIYTIAPLGTLVAAQICFGILTKYNEVTAFKAGGVSVHRLALPVLFASLVVSGLLFAFDHYYIPEANRRQEMLRAVIKNATVETYLNPNRQWVFGDGPRIYNFKYLDARHRMMSKVNVYELDMSSFRIVHQISADSARWDPGLKTWVFTNGLSIDSTRPNAPYKYFYGGSASFPELTESPKWFVKEEKQYKEMNFLELKNYIHELKTSGVDTTPLQVEYYKKFAIPLFALIMAMLSIPFAFTAGRRGAMTGVAVSLGIAIAYWTLGTVSDQLGDLNQLPAAMAAWSPDAIFSLAGLYFMARMKT